MENQLELIFDVIKDAYSSDGLDDVLDELLREEELSSLRKNLFIESVKSAFGFSRGGRPFKPDEEAWAWINESTDSPFSFEKCCRELAADPDLDCAGLDPDNLLGLLRWNRRRMLGHN